MKNTESNGEKDDIYGYRYDPVLRRYYKLGGEPYKKAQSKGPSHSFSKDKQKKKSKCGQRTGCFSASSIHQALELREAGFSRDLDFSKSLTKMKLSQFKSSYSQDVMLTPEVATCDYIQGHRNHLIGVWSTDDEVPGIVIKGEFVNFDQVGNEISLDSYFSDENCVISKIHAQEVLRDMCVGDLDPDTLVVAYVASTDMGLGKFLTSAGCYAFSPERGAEDATLAWCSSYAEASECCAFGSTRKRIAVGQESSVKLSCISGAMSERLYNFSGRPFSLLFGPDDNILYCGLTNGNLYAIDIRASHRSPPAVRLKLTRGLFNIQLLSNQTTLIASAFDDQIINVDMRSRRTVFQYPNHVNSSRKFLPLSYDETWNVLCSPGQDNVTRLWSLTEGELLLSVPAPLGNLKGNLHKSWFQSTCRGPLLHLWQGNSVYLYQT